MCDRSVSGEVRGDCESGTGLSETGPVEFVLCDEGAAAEGGVEGGEAVGAGQDRDVGWEALC